MEVCWQARGVGKNTIDTLPVCSPAHKGTVIFVLPVSCQVDENLYASALLYVGAFTLLFYYFIFFFFFFFFFLLLLLVLVACALLYVGS
jgi:hypothetical protein